MKPIVRLIRLAALSLLIAVPVYAAGPFEEGKDYTRLSQPVPGSGGDKILVVEVFSYACPGCFAFEPIITDWYERQPADVKFERLHAQFNRSTENLARAYHTAKALGVLETIHPALFKAIHAERKPANTQAQIAEIFAAQGVDKATFNKTYQSFGVSSQLKQDEAKIRGYQITQTPQMAVNGQYLVLPANTFERTLEVTEYLINKARQERRGE